MHRKFGAEIRSLRVVLLAQDQGDGRQRRIESQDRQFTSSEGDTLMKGITIDPVCGMNVEHDHAAGVSEYQGETYYFCCADCKRLFDEDPTNYVNEETAEHVTRN
jgi:YHS domain-containing protein